LPVEIGRHEPAQTNFALRLLIRHSGIVHAEPLKSMTR
jgi:hypothetical protein